MPAFNLSKITSSYLDTCRTLADPLADKVVAKIINSGEEPKINELMMQLFQNDSFHQGMFEGLGKPLSDCLDEYILESGQEPEWFQHEKILEGERIFSLYGPEVFMLLNVSSLPLCYTCAKGAQVLYETGRLLSHNSDVDPLARRLMETAQMVVNVLSEGGLSKGGKGIVTLQKVRLIHASIRHFLKAGQYHDTSWDVAKFGEPINQEDLAGTLMSFGPVIINGLTKLNVKLSEQQQDAYMHCWKVVGHFMGIEHALLPDTYQEGFDLASQILKHQAASSEAGQALANSCIQFVDYLIPGNAFDRVPGYFIHYFLEDFSNATGIDLGACIGLSDRHDHKDKMMLALSQFFVGKISDMEEHALIQRVSSYINKKMLEGIIHHYNHGKKVQFFIPPSLQGDWGLANEWVDELTSPIVFGHRLSIQKRDAKDIN